MFPFLLSFVPNWSLEIRAWTFISSHSRNQKLLLSTLVLWGLFLFLGLLLFPTAVFAHSDLIRATPTAGATVTSNLQEIELVFSEPVTNDSNILLFDDGFTIIPLKTRHNPTAPNIVSAPIEQSLDSGNYTVQWTAVSPDGHEITGSYQFNVSNRNQYPFFILGLFGILIVVIVFRWHHSANRPQTHLLRKQSHRKD